WVSDAAVGGVASSLSGRAARVGYWTGVGRTATRCTRFSRMRQRRTTWNGPRVRETMLCVTELCRASLASRTTDP
ncbi:hypothetical protein BHE74_00018680, partial [Ensete ventricosum]